MGQISLVVSIIFNGVRVQQGVGGSQNYRSYLSLEGLVDDGAPDDGKSTSLQQVEESLQVERNTFCYIPN